MVAPARWEAPIRMLGVRREKGGSWGLVQTDAVETARSAGSVLASPRSSVKGPVGVGRGGYGVRAARGWARLAQ